jgi:hypothetical protein
VEKRSESMHVKEGGRVGRVDRLWTWFAILNLLLELWDETESSGQQSGGEKAHPRPLVVFASSLGLYTENKTVQPSGIAADLD